MKRKVFHIFDFVGKLPENTNASFSKQFILMPQFIPYSSIQLKQTRCSHIIETLS